MGSLHSLSFFRFEPRFHQLLAKALWGDAEHEAVKVDRRLDSRTRGAQAGFSQRLGSNKNTSALMHAGMFFFC